MCYCSTREHEILEDIQKEAIPEEALMNKCCWTTICRVRARNMTKVNADNWSKICQKRGYLRYRQNPRGF